MSADHPQSDVPSLDEDLVAYLDGELDDPASKRLEERLANDESARERLRALAGSWNLLDHLPRAAMDEAFTRTTVELVVDEARKDIAAEQAALPARNRRRWIAAAVAGLAAAMIGFVAVVVAWPDKNEQLLRDLPVVQNLEQYEILPQKDSIKFLRDLENEELFVADLVSEGEAEHQAFANDDGILTADELTARRSYVEQLAPDMKVQLGNLFERLQKRSAVEQERLRQLDAALRSDSNEPRLRAVLQSYHDWLPTLTPFERAKLLDASADEALAIIRELKKEEMRVLARSGKSGQGPLTLNDVQKIDDWIQARTWPRREEILKAATDRQRNWFENEVPEHRKKEALVRLSIAVQPWPPNPPKLDEADWNDLLNQLPTVKALFTNPGRAIKEDLLKQSLPKEVRAAIYAQVSKATNRESQQKLLFMWHWSGRRARDAVGGGVTREELMRFFHDELTQQERDELAQNSTSSDQFRRELQRKYFFQKELPPPREPWRRGKWDRGRGGGGHGRERGHPRAGDERHPRDHRTDNGGDGDEIQERRNRSDDEAEE
jgi:hypothetical protein